MIRLILILIVVLPTLSFAQIDSLVHLFAYGGGGNDVGEAICATNDGGYIVIGSTASSGDGNTDIYLLKVDSLCTYEWSYALGEAGNDWGYSVLQTQDSGYLIASSSNSYGGSYQACLMKRDASGNYVWQKTYGKDDWDFVYDITTTYDNGFVFCGETYNNTNGYSDVWIVKINSFGDTLWTRTVGGNLIDKGNTIIETIDSNIIIGGIKTTISDSTQAYVLKFNKEGNLLWDSVYGGQNYEWIFDVIENEPYKYTFAGSTNSNTNGDLDYYIFNTNQNGSLQWDFTITNSADNDEMHAMDLMPDGKILFIGYTATGGGGKNNVAMFTFTSNGFWGGESTVISNKEDDVINSLTINSQGRIVGAGVTNSFGNGNNDVLLLRMDVILPSNDTTSLVYNDIAPIGVQDYTVENQYIYPTIVDDYLLIGHGFKFDKIQVTNIKGQIIQDYKVSENNIKVTNLTSGLYIVSLFHNNKLSYQTKIIKK